MESNEMAPAGQAGGTQESGQAHVDYNATEQKVTSKSDHAAALAAAGIPVFPVELTAPDVNGKRKKKPIPSNGHHAATTDARRVKQWWKNYPHAAVGVPTGEASNLMALDADPEGMEWASDHAELLMGAPLVNYTERGHHYVWPYHDGIRNSAGKVAQGIDVRGEGGWILWWPAEGRESYGSLSDMSPAPAVLVELIQGSQRPTEAAEGIAGDEQGQPINQGHRNATLTSEAGRLRRYDWGYQEILHALHGLNATRCTPPLDDAEVEQIARSVTRYEPAEGLEAQAEQKTVSFDLSAARVGDLLDSDPPPRRWLIDQRLPLDVVGLLAAAGGTGKSMATLQLAVSVATGLPWLDMPVGETGEVVIFSAEDDRGEIHRRLNCVVQEVVDLVDPFDPEPSEQHRQALKERLFIFDRVGADNRMTHKVNGETQRTLFANYVSEAVNQLENCKLVVLDPLSRFDGGEPNDNADGTRLIEAAEYIRRQTGATVLLPHHVSKASMKDSDAGQEAVRGASGLVDGARWVGVLAGLRKDEAKKYGVDEDNASRYVRFTTPKANYSAPWEGCWLERRAGGVLVPSELTPTKEDQKERKAENQHRDIVANVTDLLRKHGPMSRKKIENDYGGTTNVLKASKHKVRDSVNRAIEEGDLMSSQPVGESYEVVKPLSGNLAGRASA